MLWPQPADAIECWEALRTEARGRSSRSDPLARFYAPTELSSTTARRILVDCAVPPCGPPISSLARPSPACAARR